MVVIRIITNTRGLKNMRYSPLIVALLLLLSSIAAIGISIEADVQEQMKLETDFFSCDFEETIIDDQVFLSFKGSESFSVIHHAGEPMLPRTIQTIELPFGTKITDVSCDIDDVETVSLDAKILPAPKPVIQGLTEKAVYEMNDATYGSDVLYPNDWYAISCGAGLNKDNEHVNFVTIQSYPVRYNPVKDEVIWAKDISLTLTIEKPETLLLTTVDEFDMVIIAPNSFSQDLQRLVDHKNNVGMKTYLKTTEEIYSQYTGADTPEQIKYFIKDAIETQGITYVMLVGGLKSIIYAQPRDDPNKGDKDWLLPVRYTSNREMGAVHDPGFISDLYYADIYDAEGNFSSWDQDKYGESDGIFAKWSMFAGGKDILDLYPDVYVGRLACRNNYEVNFMVDKIITYETESSGASWFNRMIVVGGDSHHDSSTNYNEGEVVCNHILETYMSSFTPVKLYASFKTSNPDFVPSDTNIIREVDQGAGFFLFDGHGSPGSWNTHWPGEHNWQDTPGGISCYDFMDMANAGKYPITVVGGCHNSQFNVSLIYTLFDMPYSWSHGVPYAECFGWHLARKKDGGGIASLGNTGLGYGAVGNHADLDGDGIDLPDTCETLGGYQEVAFFKAYDEGLDILGEVWAGAERDYLNVFPGMEDQTDCKTVTQWPLLGDPSLKIGGYN